MRYVASVNDLSKSGTIGDYDFTILRYSEGAKDLEPEESDNTSLGLVITPESIEGLTITFDAWEIEKENTIGLFGRNNNGVMDLLLRLQAEIQTVIVSLVILL